MSGACGAVQPPPSVPGAGTCLREGLVRGGGGQVTPGYIGGWGRGLFFLWPLSWTRALAQSVTNCGHRGAHGHCTPCINHYNYYYTPCINLYNYSYK